MAGDTGDAADCHCDWRHHWHKQCLLRDPSADGAVYCYSCVLYLGSWPCTDNLWRTIRPRLAGRASFHRDSACDEHSAHCLDRYRLFCRFVLCHAPHALWQARLSGRRKSGRCVPRWYPRGAIDLDGIHASRRICRGCWVDPCHQNLRRFSQSRNWASVSGFCCRRHWRRVLERRRWKTAGRICRRAIAPLLFTRRSTSWAYRLSLP